MVMEGCVCDVVENVNISPLHWQQSQCTGILV